MSATAAACNDSVGAGVDDAPRRGWLGHGELRRRGDRAAWYCMITRATMRRTHYYRYYTMDCQIVIVPFTII